MNKDLKQIKKYYGEDMMHYCRDNFPTLVEENKMYDVLNKHFQHNKFLYNDLKESDLFLDFNNYIHNFLKNKENKLEETLKTPTELLSEAGYILYECKSEKDIQAFKKYYASGEELCTFNGGRLDGCYVFFAIKKDVDIIRRENFKNPKRQDEYGTSVISIQFSKNDSHTLSIKNRYNHTVNNPDNTFNNNLDNIIPGLTYSFEHYYGMKQLYINNDFEIPSYISVNNKYYKYNKEIINKYYCIDNVIIEDGVPKKYDKEKYIVMDGFILDLVNKKFLPGEYCFSHSFTNIKRNIEKIDVTNTDYGKRITLYNYDKTYEVIMLNKENNIIGYVNNFINIIGDYFLVSNENIKYLELNNVEYIGDKFLMFNNKLKEINFPKLKEIGNEFLYYNKIIHKLNLPNVLTIGNYFLGENKKLEKLILPNVKKVGIGMLNSNTIANEVDMPECQIIDDCFLPSNRNLKSINIPKIESIGDYFLPRNENLKKVINNRKIIKILKKK